MNVWLWAAVALLLGFVPCGYVCLRARMMDAVVGLQLAGILEALAIVLIAEGLRESIFYDVALVAAFLSFVGTLAFARFLERGI
jgi:multicomponent Na+:H+ antiporter subunit F